jgi:flagellar motility protein MotE (MotC chaperone)
MKYLQAMAVAVFAAALVMGAPGCGEEKSPAPDTVEGVKTAQLQKDLDQAKQDLKKAQDELEAKRADLAAKTAEVQNLQKQLDAANAKLADIMKTVQDAMKAAAPAAVSPMAPATPPSQ